MPRTLLLISYTLFSISLHAQYAATIELFEPVGDVLYTIGADVNEDGASDVICATNERLCWLEQLPDGTFSKHRLIAESGYYYRTLVMADIDEDGHQDLVFASTELGIGAHLNLGGGHWGPVIPLYDEGAVIDCYLADLNEDDHVDIMLARAGGVWWMAGQGDATFGPAQLISDQHANTNSLHAEDLDGDGDEDILVAAFSNKRLAWHQNLGSGNFGDYQIIDTVYAGPRSVITADFDGDEQPDIACAYRSEDEGGAGLVWYRNLGGGDFALVDTLMGRGFHEYVQAADMDGDNDMDLVSCHGLDEMDWLANDGAGHFSEPIELERYAAYLRQVDLHDLNADGYPDVLYGISSTSPQKENLLWRASTGPGAFAPPALLTIGARTASIPQVADIDQDGLSDIVVGLDGPDALVWLKNEGHGFSPAHLIARRHNYNPGSIAIADINNDGWPDVLAGSIADNATNASQFCFYVNDGDGSFTAMPPFESFYYPQRDMHVVDMDGDGDLDMLWASPGYNFQANSSLGWVRNDGSSWSDPIILLSEVVVIADVLPTDLDADGQLDLIICKQDAPQLIRMEHTGGGNFSIQQQINSNFTSALRAQAADINGDGLLDLVASTDQHAGGTSRIAWFPNLASGVLGTQQDIYVGNPPLEHFVLRDYDLDGQVDILASTYYEYRILFFRGQPGATFLAPQPIEGTLGKTRGFSLHDLDHDGDWDIVGRAVDPATTGIDKVFVSYSLANDESISGIIFNDLNANGEQDPGEMGIGRVPIQVEPDALAVFADEEGQFTVYGADGTYTLIPQPDDCWTLTSMPAAYEVTFDGTYLDTLRFGLGPDTETPEAGVSLASAPTRCGFTVPFWLNYRNDGCWTFDGEVYLVLHELATFAEATPMPTHTEGDTLFWSFNDLPPGSSQSVELMMTIAGVEFLGSTLEISTGIIPNNAAGQALPAETFDFYATINCAYDPNDKQVHPNRAEQAPFTENYTLFDEHLLYTLRFQNTGTDTAFNIVLRDQLSPDLDWSTFRPVSSSHPYEATLHDDGLLEFHFRDILLPDSTTNEPGSHGFVQFEIKALPGLAEGTAIENTAGIYFDFNPPIITNTVNSMMVTSLPNFSPAAAFTYVANELTVDFSDASTNVPDSWLWEFGDGETSMDQHPVHSFAAGGTYPVCLTVSNDWGSAQYCENITLMATATQDPLASTGITFQPNPARETVWLETTLPVPQQLVLFSAAGQPLQTIILREKRMTWDISTLPAGSYWLRTEQGEVWPLVVVK